MKTVAEACEDAVAFSYRSMDRLILNAYIPTLQTPAAMAVFLRQVCGKPFLSGLVFKELTDRFVDDIRAFAQRQGLEIVHPPRGVRPGLVGQKALEAAARQDRWGVVGIVSHQEQARVFVSQNTNAGKKGSPSFRVKEDRRLVNYYYFYIRDPRYGDGYIRFNSYPPFQTRIWMNAHGFMAGELRRRQIGFQTADNCFVQVDEPAALNEVARQFDSGRIEEIARQWLALVPDPLTPGQRQAGYPCYLSVYQAEFSDNVIFRKTQVLNRVYEQLLRDHLHLGRLDMVKILFARNIGKNTRTKPETRILRRGVQSCLKVFYKGSFLKQYNKQGRLLRTELCVNNPRDFRVPKSLVHLGRLDTIAQHALTRFLKAQAVAWSTALDRSTLERMSSPSLRGGMRVAALRFGAPRTMRVLEALGCAGLSFHAFSNAELRGVLAERLGAPAEEATAGRIGYELRKLRGHGLVRKAVGRNRYTLTDPGYRVSLGFTKIHQRLLSPALDTFDATLRQTLGESAHPLDQSLHRLNRDFDELAQLSGLRLTG
jgi:hypothetical protein